MPIWWIFFCKLMFLSQFSHLDIWKLSSWWGSTLGHYLIVHLPLNFVLCPCPSLLLWFYLLQDFLLCIFKSAYNLLSWAMFCTSASLQRFFFSYRSSLTLINVITVVIFLNIFPRLSLGFKIYLVVVPNFSLQFRIALFLWRLFYLVCWDVK